ncbi:MAG: LacI family DNA-binding transcriptional regulator [Oscillibacter sp.]|nr:LacI family DNA-binding transcriptional regulator [Oscillibacter sp.]
MSARKDISIKTVAERCGVSTATVSRVLNGDAYVSASTREKVLAAMEECGYQPSTVAATGIKKVGVIIDTQVNDYYHALLIQLHDTLDEAGIKTIFTSLGYRRETLPDTLRTVYDSNVCGVILITCDYLSIKGILNQWIPHVWIDCNDPPEATGTICQVQSEQYISGVMAAQELYRKGSEKPIFLGGSIISHRMRERFAGFCAEYRKHGIEIGEDRIFQTPRVREVLDESKQAIRYLYSSGFPFDGVFAISDWRALGAYLALTELGIRVPEEVKIIGYDGVSVASRTILNITSIQQNIHQIARSAADLLIRQMNRQPIEQKRVIVPTSILSGQTI